MRDHIILGLAVLAIQVSAAVEAFGEEAKPLCWQLGENVSREPLTQEDATLIFRRACTQKNADCPSETSSEWATAIEDFVAKVSDPAKDLDAFCGALLVRHLVLQ